MSSIDLFLYLASFKSILVPSFWILVVLLPLVYFVLIKPLDCDLSLRFNEIFHDHLRPRRKSRLKGKVIWITGASSGIGEHLAYVLVQFGVKLVLSGRNTERLERVRNNCRSKGCPDSDITLSTFDLKHQDQHHEALDQAIRKFGKVDVLINNAGTSQRCAFELIESRVDRDLFENNVFGGVALARLLVKHWYTENIAGQIVVTSSIVGKAALPQCASYAASKHALHGYYESLRYEAASRGVTITMVCSGPVKTPIAAVSYTGNYGETLGGLEAEGRMCPKRHAKLMALAMELKLEEAWITIQPFLWYCYAHQYFPTLSRRYGLRMANRLAQTRDQ